MTNWSATIYNSLEELEAAIEAISVSSYIELVCDPITGRYLLAETG